MNEDRHIFLANLIRLIKTKQLDDNYLSIFPKSVEDYFINSLNIATENTNTKQFPDFGLYIYKKRNYKLMIRCGDIGQKGKGGHSHNDQLSIYLNIGNIKTLVDSGTYTYTSNYILRNKYRSTSMHNTLQLDNKEQNDWFKGDKEDLFWLATNRANPKVILINESEFIGEHYGFEKPHRRKLQLQDNIISCEDICEANGIKRVYFHFHPSINLIEFNENSIIIDYEDEEIARLNFNDKSLLNNYDYSPKYGVKIPAKKLTIETSNSSTEWQIEINTINNA